MIDRDGIWNIRNYCGKRLDINICWVILEREVEMKRCIGRHSTIISNWLNHLKVTEMELSYNRYPKWVSVLWQRPKMGFCLPHLFSPAKQVLRLFMLVESYCNIMMSFYCIIIIIFFISMWFSVTSNCHYTVQYCVLSGIFVAFFCSYHPILCFRYFVLVVFVLLYMVVILSFIIPGTTIYPWGNFTVAKFSL